MIPRSLKCHWTEEDRLTRARWMRGMAIFYGCIGLVLLGIIAFVKPSSVALNGLLTAKPGVSVCPEGTQCPGVPENATRAASGG
jgi:hypothetical protein